MCRERGCRGQWLGCPLRVSSSSSLGGERARWGARGAQCRMCLGYTSTTPPEASTLKRPSGQSVGGCLLWESHSLTRQYLGARGLGAQGTEPETPGPWRRGPTRSERASPTCSGKVPGAQGLFLRRSPEPARGPRGRLQDRGREACGPGAPEPTPSIHWEPERLWGLSVNRARAAGVRGPPPRHGGRLQASPAGNLTAPPHRGHGRLRGLPGLR